MSGRAHFSTLNDPQDKSFVDELKKIPATLKIEDSAAFFKHILSLFKRKTVPNDVGNEILLTICKLLTIADHKKVFISNNFIKLLPIENFLLSDNILNILDLLITSKTASKQILTPSFLEPIVKRNPCKTLILLGKFFQSTNVESIYVSQASKASKSKRSNRNRSPSYDDDNSESYEWVNILFTTDSFKRPDCAQNYISLLIYFLENNDDFANDYSQKVWDVICLILQSQNDNIIKYAYQSLCFLIDNQISDYPKIPFELVASHLTKLTLQKMAMSLLFRCQLTEMNSKKLIKVLIHLASTKKKAFIILERIAETENGAFLLIEDSSWMGTSLPDKLSTVNLFCGVLMHNDLREVLSSNARDVVNFLITAFSIESNTNSDQESKRKRSSSYEQKNERQSDNSVVVQMLCTILKRIPMNKELVKQMSRSSFLGAYFSKATKQDKNAVYAFHVIRLIADCCYVNDLLNVIDFLVTSIKKNDDNSNFALDVSTSLCQYEPCVNKFRDKKIDQYLLNLPKITKYQKRFLQSLDVID